jgi:hypothetical protein
MGGFNETQFIAVGCTDSLTNGFSCDGVLLADLSSDT